jgi:oligopeptide/dipeptide ABC transporter ATP-binding protein
LHQQNDILLDIQGLRTSFLLQEGTVRAVDGVDLRLRRGGTLGVVGESGCGKSVTAFSILQLVPRPGHVVGGSILFRRRLGAGGDGESFETLDLVHLPSQGDKMRAIRGGEIGMIFQEPMTSLSMMHTVGFQIVEALQLHKRVGKREAREIAVDMLGRTGIPDPGARFDAYPFQLSGGMRQRAMIAMALVCGPALLIADEPTTALDVTTQAQILELIRELQHDLGMAMILITHDLGIVAETCDELAVMYLGEVVEHGDVRSVLHDPLHPYTKALLHSIPRLGKSRKLELEPIEGAVPDPYNRPAGCPFHPRCTACVSGVCDREHPDTVDAGGGRSVRCVLFRQ